MAGLCVFSFGQCHVVLMNFSERLMSSSLVTLNGNYYPSTDPNAPNPALVIDGIGLVGLPLSERDAKVIISHASQAPFGKGNQTVIDTTVRGTWEIEPENVSFRNPR